jgi:hypothetical protein
MLDRLARLLADAAQAVDARLPVAVNKRTGAAFGAGLGPHSESETFKLIVDAARATNPGWLMDAACSIPIPGESASEMRSEALNTGR